MANRRMEFFIGMTVIVIFVAVAVMTVLFGPQQGLFVSGGGKRMKIVFEKANGITNTSKVLKNGVDIGRVYRRELKEDENGKTAQVQVFFELYPGNKIFSNEHAQIRRNLVGDAMIEFVKNAPVPNEPTPVELNSSTTITGTPGSDLAGTVSNIEGDLAATLKSINEAAARLTDFMNNLNTFFGDKNELQKKKAKLERIFTELESTLKSIHQLAGNMNDIVSDKELRQNILAGSAAVPKIVEKVDKLMANANTLTTDIRRTIDRSFSMFEQVEKNLSNLDDFTSALADQGPEFITSLTDSAKKVQTMVGNISELAGNLSDQMKNPESPLGMLSDKKTAQAIRRILDNTAVATEKVHPILDDARVFSNKIAHKPSLLLWGGATYKGALTPGNDSGYGMQKNSPNGGFYSSLYKPTNGSTSGSGCPLFGGNSCFSKLTGKKIDNEDSGIDNGSAMIDPNSLSYYYRQNPPEENRGSSCLSKLMPNRAKGDLDIQWNGYYGEYPQGTVQTGPAFIASSALPEAGSLSPMSIESTPIQPSAAQPVISTETEPSASIMPQSTMSGQIVSGQAMPQQALARPMISNGQISSGQNFSEPMISRQGTVREQNGSSAPMMTQNSMVDDEYGNGYNNFYAESQAARVAQPNRRQTSRMQSSLKPIYSKIFHGSDKKTQTASRAPDQRSGYPYSEMPMGPAYAGNAQNGYGQAPAYNGNVSGYNNFGSGQGMNNGVSRQESGLISDLNENVNETPLVQRVPVARAQRTVETRIAPEAVESEELPQSIIRKRPTSERTFSDDGLPMEILN